MEFRKILALRGPNYWANFPVLEGWLDLGTLKDSPSDELPGFNERLMVWLPSLIEHRCSIGHRGGFFERLKRGTYQGHILEHVALELQTLAGSAVGFGRTRETGDEGVYKVAVEYEDETLGRAAMESARQLCLAAINDQPFDVTAEITRLRDVYHTSKLGPSTGAIVDAAVARGIPFRRLSSGSFVQLGWGARQRRIIAAETDRTGAIAETIAQDKDLTRSMLRSIGVPVPAGRPVENPEDAWAAAQELGLPVVVKPQYGSQGRGVATNLTTRDQVITAYAAAREHASEIIVEKFVVGADYRVLVVGDKVIAAARREPAQVVGDGQHSVSRLVEIVNTDPRRGEEHATVLSKIHLDSIALAVLAEQGFTPDSIPAAGAKVLIRRNANLSTGGTAEDVTSKVHPAVADRAIEAARMVGLDVAGVDIVARDLSRPLEEQGGVIVEINASPGLRMHLQPSSGQPQPVGEAIAAAIFPEGQNGRIPIVAVTGTNGKTTTTRLLAYIFRTLGRHVGMTCTEGIYVDGRRIETGDCSGPLSAQSLLANPLVEVAVLETARGGILRSGLGFDLCDVAVVTNIGDGDHLGLNGIETIEKLARVKRVVVEVVQPQGAAVLNAADPHVADMAGTCPGNVIFFAIDSNDIIREHRAGGGRAVIVRDGIIQLADGEREIPLVALSRVPLTHGGRIGFQVENVLAAVAASWAQNVPRDVVRSALESFGSGLDHLPGRFNLLEYNGATIVVDYGHNVSSLKAVISSLRAFPHEHRTVVYTAAGDRRDADMIDQGRLIGDAFDQVILYEDHYIRGRAQGEIMELLKQGISHGKRAMAIREVPGSVAAMETALAGAQRGELVVVQADTVDDTVQFFHEFLARFPEAREISLCEAIEVPLHAPTPEPAVAVYATHVVD